ncbi:myelin-associated glycoprotein-like [Scyliorhinus canicula]|uniref:myelin-associated glycoprotein-like n=1 Tax=Scyliorhinus canicula TaxID=7830 RepID=UPI0018F54825|nr:myelin-associated glycoprotein-like [Scyliorhinus canicula]XP_038670876.1 myelin-associated glycoprotein-like [Scyliorhinus canicula]
MIGKSYFLLSLLQVGLSQEWKANIPEKLTAEKGSCVQIPCHYSYPMHLASRQRVGIWYYYKRRTTAFHSKDQNVISPQFQHRTRLSGDLNDGDCSLIISNIGLQDVGRYYFRIEFDASNKITYKPGTRLQVSVALSHEWKANILEELTAENGSCVQIPCHYSYPMHLASRQRVGIWYYYNSGTTAFHSKDQDVISPQFQHRTRLSGDLNDGNCSLIISNIGRQDVGTYYFRIEFDGCNKFTYKPGTRLQVSDFTDKPRIFPAEIIAGKRVDISCTFNTTCSGIAPVLTWDTPTDVPGSVSKTVTQHGVALTYTSVLTLIPSLRHHGQNLTCGLRYPSVSSERTLVLTVQFSPQNLSMTSLDMINASWINIIEGNSTVIICSVESFPASNLTWRHLNVTMNRTSSNNELWLVIPQVTSRDTGDYECAAENEHGAMEGSIAITVEYPPQETMVSISRPSSGIREGNSITLTCSSESVPPISHYTWFRIEGNTSIQLNTSSRTLSFTSVTRENDGSFYCTVRNPLGNSTSNITHLDVEYEPDISQESKCYQQSEGVTCFCVSNSNPPGVLTWHLPAANISDDQTHKHVVSRSVRDGHLVNGSLILTGLHNEEEVTASCLVRNPHGEAMFKVYLWAKGRNSNKWTVGLLTAGIILSVFVVGILIFLNVRKIKTLNKERGSETKDLSLSTRPVPVKHQGKPDMLLTDPGNTNRGTTGDGKTPALRDLSEGPMGGDAECGNADNPADLLYANINFLKLPSADGTVHREEETEYAQIRFQQN